MKILPILICGLVVGLLHCTREYSCENCGELQTDTIRTTPNELITSCNIFIPDENGLKWIYPQVKTKKWLGSYWIFDSIKMDGSKQYNQTYDLKNYLSMSDYKINDTFLVRYEIRYRLKPVEFEDLDTLIY